MNKEEQNLNNPENPKLGISGVSISFVAKFDKYQDEYERFLMWLFG